MKAICDAAKDCLEIRFRSCGHQQPHEEKAGCNYSCADAELHGKTGKCVPFKEATQ